MNRRDRALHRFKPCVPPLVVRDHTLGGQPVLLLGWWLDALGKPVKVEVATLASRRRPTDISTFPEPPGSPFPHVVYVDVVEAPRD